ncbi:MAG: response regulator [Acidimicrobiales bacterium]
MARILIVDDEPDIRELVRLNLELAGHEIIEAADGVEGAELAVGEHPDLIVLDVMMPNMDGFEVLAQLKATPDPLVAEIPVIMLTARSDDLDRVQGGIEGALRYLTKPFAPAELREQVEVALAASEPQERLKTQRAALADLARIERGDGAAPSSVSPRLTKLDRPPEQPTAARPAPPAALERMASMSAKQSELLEVVATTPTVSEAAARLQVSRSNVYASLRRIARKLGVASVPELVAISRAGVLHPDRE